MIGNGSIGVGARLWAAFSLGLFAAICAQSASAADCPGHPDALGTSRILVVDPREHPRIGAMQYTETLPLEDHEVVLTFDDGPLPRNSNQILDILAAQCVKATFFTVGRMAQSSPEGVRKLRAAGHSIGTHTQNHPLRMNRMPFERAQLEIDDGIASVKAALGDDAALAPFLRIPGLARATAVEDYLALQGIQVWSADFPADDWRHISSSRVYDLAIKRLEARGKGILLLHDIQARTVAALPRILHEMKARGYRIVHVVPATAERPATPTEPQQWQLHPTSENVAISHWPKIPNFVFVAEHTLAAPSPSDLDWQNEQLPPTAEPFLRAARRAGGVPLLRESPWPRQATFTLDTEALMLPTPATSLFAIQENPRGITFAPFVHHAERVIPAADTGAIRPAVRGKPSMGRGRRLSAHHPVAGRGSRHAAPAARSASRRVIQVKQQARGGAARRHL